ncbi:MAG: FecR domain-containing protein [Deltaproteobacteria bacterium]|nr:FecR domain-containing protein [Deltaproteobacteria bacterium]
MCIRLVSMIVGITALACDKPAPPPSPAGDVPLAAPPAAAPATKEGGHWRLEYRSATPIVVSGNPCYAHSSSGGQTSATVTSRLTCGDKPWTGVVAGRWTDPPATLAPDDTLSMSIAGRASASHAGITASTPLAVQLDHADCGGTYGRTEIARLHLASDGSGDGATGQASGSAVVPGRDWGKGSPGLEDKLKLSVCMERWQAYFIYAWQEGAPPASGPRDAAPGKVPIPPAPGDDEPITTGARIWQPQWKDSGVRFSDLAGQVEWRGPDDEEGWQFANLDQPLPVGAHVRTMDRSSAILTFPGMIHFTQRPETEVVLSEPASESPIELMAGVLWINIKKMVKDGSMDIEMSQAVAGGRGTIFETSERAGESSVSVCEGRVTFTHKATREALDLGPGERAVATPAGITRSRPGAPPICEAHARDTEAVHPAGKRPATGP